MRSTMRTLILALGLSVALPVSGLTGTSSVSSPELDAALASSVAQEDAAREQVRQLLSRDDVQALAEASGLDLRRADAAVATLDGEELEEAARLAARADDALAGGNTVTISLVAALLIVIIIILLVD